jgi:hypothetical protein
VDGRDKPGRDEKRRHSGMAERPDPESGANGVTLYYIEIPGSMLRIAPE